MRMFTAVGAAFVLIGAAQAQETTVTHGLSLFGELKYPADFPHFEYVNPEAPKGGTVRLSAPGTFDTLNPFVIKGTPAAGGGLVYDTLLEGAQDEPSSSYGLLAESVEVSADLSWVAFTLRKEARWHDGKPITPDDVIFTFNILKHKGRPSFRYYYANVAAAQQIGEHSIKFTFTGPTNRELPLIVGQLPVVPKHYWEGREFDSTTLEPPLGSGPYRVESLDPGRSITYRRVGDYWAKDLAVTKGRYNFDQLRYEYYRDPTIALEAFKANRFDLRFENNSKLWATSYDFPAIRDGRVRKEEPKNQNPTGMQAFVFNLRRAKFQDRRVRQALAYAFDFEWSNKNLFYNQYTRTMSYFSNSELAATGLPSTAEFEFLEPLRGQIPEEVFTTEYAPPSTDGSGRIRKNLRTARELLRSAGWQIKDGKLTNQETGEAMTIEFLIRDTGFERVIAPLRQNLERLGVQAKIRLVDTSQYQRRTETFDFDMVIGGFGQSLSPGNEQRYYWGSAAADREGSPNLIGIKNSAVDTLIDNVIFAKNRKELVAATRALDRVLLWGHYVIPNWHIRKYRIAYWDRFARPDVFPNFGRLGWPDTWWLDDAKDAALKQRQAAEKK